MRKLLWITVWCLAAVAVVSSCKDAKPPTAPAVRLRDSSTLITSYGISKLISDSGRMRYKIVAEEWRIYDRTDPPRHTFPKGLLLEKFDQKFHIEMYLTADTAYWYNQNLWELRGRVRVWNTDGTVFTSQRLFYNMREHEFYSNVYSHLVTPDREVEGFSFRSNEKMTRYVINNTRATFPLPEGAAADDDSITLAEQNEEPVPVSEVPSRMPARATEKPNPALPPGGHFK